MKGMVNKMSPQEAFDKIHKCVLLQDQEVSKLRTMVLDLKQNVRDLKSEFNKKEVKPKYLNMEGAKLD